MFLLQTTDGQPRPAARSRPTVRAMGVAGAGLAALSVWTIAVPVLGVDLQAAPGAGPPHAIGPVPVVVSSLLAAVAGWASLALLERLTSQARQIWTVLAVAVLALSLLGPQAGVTTAATVTLAAMHLVVAAVLIPVLTSSAR